MANSLQPYQVYKAYMKAERNAFRFSGLETKRTDLQQKSSKRLKAVGGENSLAWSVISIFLLFAFIALTGYEAFVAKAAIEALIDPYDKGYLPSFTFFVIGGSLAIAALSFGHTLTEGVQTESHTGKRSWSRWFWISVAGVLVYLTYQGTISSLSVHNVGDDDGLKFMPLVVLGVALLQIIVGAIVSGKAFPYIHLNYINFRLGNAASALDRYARKTNDSYRNYVTLLDTYNRENTPSLVREGNDNIRRAIVHYSGENSVRPQTAAADNDADLQGPGNRDSHDQRNGADNSSSPNRDLDDFLDDNVDDDLTV